MQDIKKIVGGFVAVILLVAIVTLVNRSVPSTPSQALGSTEEVRFNQANTQTGVLVTTSSTLVLATSTGRQYAYLVNDSASATVYLSMNKGAAAVLYSGIALKPGMSYTINTTNGYIGAIYGIGTTSATTTVYER